MAISIIAQTVANHTGSDISIASMRTISFQGNFLSGDIVVITTMPNYGSMYKMPLNYQIPGFVRLLDSRVVWHGLNLNYRVLTEDQANLSYSLYDCYNTSAMVIRGGKILETSMNAVFPINIQLDSSVKTMTIVPSSSSSYDTWSTAMYNSLSTSFKTKYKLSQGSIIMNDTQQYGLPNGYKNYLIIKEDDQSSKPTAPGAVSISGHYIAGEKASVSWTASTVLSGVAITYDLYLMNQSQSLLIAKDITTNNATVTMPSGVKNSTAKIKVVAKTSQSATEGLESNTFKVSPHLILIEDGSKLKTIKNGVTQAF